MNSLCVYRRSDELYSGIANGRVFTEELYTHRNQKFISLHTSITSALILKHGEIPL